MNLSNLWRNIRSPRTAQKALVLTALLYCAGIQSDTTLQPSPKPLKKIDEIIRYSTDLEVTKKGVVYNPHGMYLYETLADIESLSYFMNPLASADDGFEDNVFTNLINIHNQEVGDYSGGLARGVLLNQQGFFLTNHHIISTTRGDAQYYSDQRSITVILRDGTTRPTTILASDFNNDLALGKVDLGNYKVNSMRLFPNTKGVELGKEVYIAAFGWYKDNELVMEPGEGNMQINMIFPGQVTGHLDSISIRNESGKYSLDQLTSNSFAFTGISGSPVFDPGQMIYGIMSSICAPDRYMILTYGEHFIIKKFISLESANFIPSDSIRRLVFSYYEKALQVPAYPYIIPDQGK